MPRRGDSEKACASKMQVLADETRFTVVRLLMRQPHHVHELNAALGIEPTLLSHHLRILRDAGIVESVRDGKARLYRLAARVHKKSRENILDLGCCTMTFN